MFKLHFPVFVLWCIFGVGLGAAGSFAAEPKPIRLGDVSTGTLTYPALDHLDFREGTLECWVKFAFDPNDYLPAKEYTGMLVLVGLNGDQGGLGVHFMAQPAQKEACYFVRWLAPLPWFFIGGAKTALFNVCSISLWCGRTE